MDCGAFDGDSVQEFLKRRSGSFGQIIAIEPDPENCKTLEARVASLPIETGRRIKIVQSAALVFGIQFEGSITFILLFPALFYVVIYVIA